jgi:putative DNA primase/helicase
MPNPLLDAALQYAGRGWHVFPVQWMRNGQCSCRDGINCRQSAKHPRTRNGLKDATTDRTQIETWWRKWPDANLAIRTGTISGLLVLDVDGNEGVATLKEIIDGHGPLPRHTAIVLTRRGFHIYLTYNQNLDIRPSAGAGLEVRCNDAYVIAPPSRHATGHIYAWGQP